MDWKIRNIFSISYLSLENILPLDSLHQGDYRYYSLFYQNCVVDIMLCYASSFAMVRSCDDSRTLLQLYVVVVK